MATEDPVNNLSPQYMTPFLGFSQIFTRVGQVVAQELNPARFVSRANRELEARPKTVNPLLIAPDKNYEDNTLTGLPTSATPTFDGFARLAEAWQRLEAYIDYWNLFSCAPVFADSVQLTIDEACDEAWNVRVIARDPSEDRRATKSAEALTDQMLRSIGFLQSDDSYSLDYIHNILLCAMLDAGVFIQPVISYKGVDVAKSLDVGNPGRVSQTYIMPAGSMTKLTDARNEPFDMGAMYEQRDINTQGVVGNFEWWQIQYSPWRRTGSDRYGRYEYAQTREINREYLADLRHLGVRRVVNSARVMHTQIGPDGSSVDYDEEVRKYQKQNSRLKGAERLLGNPFAQLFDLYYNGNVKFMMERSDDNMDHIEDIRFALEECGSGNHVPVQIVGRNLNGMPRDTLEHLYAVWANKRLAYHKMYVSKVILNLVCFNLWLNGINPEKFTFKMVTAPSQFDSPQSAILFVTQAMSNVIGAGMSALPCPLITVETATEILSPITGVTDIKGYVAKLAEEAKNAHIDPETIHQQTEKSLANKGKKPGSRGVQNGNANPKRSGSATTGYGDRFQNGATKDGSRSTGGDGYKPLRG